MFQFGQAVTRIRASLVADAYNPDAATMRDWTNAAEVTLPAGFAIDPGGSSEFSTVNREQVTTTPTLYWLGDDRPDLVQSDRIRDAAGTVWEINGNSAAWRSPFTAWQAGAVWLLRKVEG